MLTPAQVAQFRRDGYVLGGQVITDAEVEVLRAELKRVIEDREAPGPKPVRIINLAGDDAAPVWQIVNIWEASPAFRALGTQRQIAEESAQLLNAKELRIWHDQIQYKPAATGGVNNWHQDVPYWPNLVPQGEQLTAWIALDDADADNGCMSMVPGSHQWCDQIPFLDTVRPFEAMPKTFGGHPIEVRLCPVKKGHVHYHHALTWHGSHANKSGRPRRAIAYHYMSEKTFFRPAPHHPMLPFITVQPGEKLTGEKFLPTWPQ